MAASAFAFVCQSYSTLNEDSSSPPVNENILDSFSLIFTTYSSRCVLFCRCSLCFCSYGCCCRSQSIRYLSQGYYLMGWAGPIMGLCSFWSDYTCADARHFSLPLRNRAFGLDLLAIYTYLAGLFVMLISRAGVKQALVNALGMFAGKAIVLEWSGNAANPAQWEVKSRNRLF